MNLDDMIILSIDDHTVEPPDLFEQHLPAQYKDRAPRLVRNADGKEHWEFEGKEFGILGLNATVSWPKEEWGLNPSALAEMRPAAYLIDERIRDMNRNGVLSSMCFPSLPGFSGRRFQEANDKDLALVMLQAYNDWHIDEWCASLSGPVHAAVDRPGVGHARNGRGTPARRGEGRAARSACPSFRTSRACRRTKTTTGIRSSARCATSTWWCACTSGWASTRSTWVPTSRPTTSWSSRRKSPCSRCRTCCGGPRSASIPNLKVAFSEGGIGWIPFLMDRVDRHYVNQRWTGQDFGGKMPSDVFREHSLACFIFDPTSLKLHDDIGIDIIAFETDYPHSDSLWPDAPENLLAQCNGAGLSDDEIEKVSWKNVARFCDYDPFAVIPKEAGHRGCAAGAGDRRRHLYRLAGVNGAPATTRTPPINSRPPSNEGTR